MGSHIAKPQLTPHLGIYSTQREAYPASGTWFFGYTLIVELILKLVAGLMAGLRGYFLIVAGLVVIPCIVLLLVFVVGLIKPSRSKPAADKNS